MKERAILLTVWLMVVLIIIMTWMVSCTTQRKAERFYKKHPDKLAQKCAETFPVKDSIVVIDSVHFDTLYIEGEPVIIRDSFFIKGDTIVRQITKECPKVQTITKVIRHDSIIYRRDAAYEATLEHELAAKETALGALQSKYDDTKDARNKWRLWCLITWGIIAAFLSIKILSPIKL